jgi:hypothetical protein
MSGISMFQLLPVIDQTMSVSTTTTTTNSPPHRYAEHSPDQKLKLLVDHFEKQNSSEYRREHSDFLAFLNTKRVPDDVLHLLYNEVMIKKNKHKFIDQPPPTGEATQKNEADADAGVNDDDVEKPAAVAGTGHNGQSYYCL